MFINKLHMRPSCFRKLIFEVLAFHLASIASYLLLFNVLTKVAQALLQLLISAYMHSMSATVRKQERKVTSNFLHALFRLRKLLSIMFLLLLQILNPDIQLAELGSGLVEASIVLDKFFVPLLSLFVL